MTSSQSPLAVAPATDAMMTTVAKDAVVTGAGRVSRPWAAALLAIILLSAAIDSYRILTMRSVLWKVLTEFDTNAPLLTYVVKTTWFVLLFPTLALVAICVEVFRYRYATLVNSVILVVMYLLWQLFVEGMMTPFLQILSRLSR